jgi:signal transduction histidine kinase
VTKEVELKQNLMKSNEKLQELDKRKDEFISIASHELRTPLTVIKGYSALLSDGMLGDITEKQKAYLEKITLSANNLIELVNDMLDLSKITSGRMVVSKTEVNLFDFFTRSVENMTPLFESKGISLQLLFLLPPDMKVSTDEKRLWQVMNNLLGNASKFSESGTTVSCTVEKNDTHWWFSVKDEGVGIPEDKLESIFEKFSQVENHLQRSSEGTGLGLPIVKEIVKLLGGEIFVESEISKGSCFTVKF